MIVERSDLLSLFVEVRRIGAIFVPMTALVGVGAFFRPYDKNNFSARLVRGEEIAQLGKCSAVCGVVHFLYFTRDGCRPVVAADFGELCECAREP